jgi:uncharacterized protein
VLANSCRLILDTNIVVRAFINLQSASGLILKACERRQVLPLLSRELLAEYRAILERPALLRRYGELERPEVGVSLERLLYVSDYYRRITVRFPFPRDPKDSPLLELAIYARATHLITTDEDLLSLGTGRDAIAKQFRKRARAIKVRTPEDFIRRSRDLIAPPS